MKTVYTVFLKIESEKRIEVGSLGEICFKPGIYCYVGSAMRSVEKRVGRHFENSKNLHWHIDYLSEEAEVFDYFVLPESSSTECLLSKICGKIGEAVESFGSSDCNCSSHLYRVEPE